MKQPPLNEPLKTDSNGKITSTPWNQWFNTVQKTSTSITYANTGAVPTIPPEKVGDIHVDTKTSTIYVGVNNQSNSGWVTGLGGGTVGPQGIPGIQGPPGPQGPAGSSGGITPSGTGFPHVSNSTLDPTARLIVESDLNLSANNTTNDVSTIKHGFVPTAPNDTSKFLRGDGTWSASGIGSGFLALDGSNANTTVNIGSQKLVSSGIDTGVIERGNGTDRILVYAGTNLANGAGMEFYSTGIGFNKGCINFITQSSGGVPSTGNIFFLTTPDGSSFPAMAEIESTGRLSVGQYDPTAYINIKAGSATAGFSPLKLTPGTYLTVPEVGSVEFIDNGYNGYFTATYNTLGVLKRNTLATVPTGTGYIHVTSGIGDIATATGYLFIGRQVITAASGTYTPTTGTTAIFVQVLGGGGGGAGGNGNGTTTSCPGAGGGGGGYAELWITSVGANYPYVIGQSAAGGAAGNNPGTNGNYTNFGYGPLIVCNGGGAGGTGGATANSVIFSGGNGGTSTGGDINSAGEPAGVAIQTAYAINVGGNGGDSYFGGGGQGRYASNGGNGSGYGAGGAGGGCTGTQYAGGSGSAGVIIIWEYR